MPPQRVAVVLPFLSSGSARRRTAQVWRAALLLAALAVCQFAGADTAPLDVESTAPVAPPMTRIPDSESSLPQDIGGYLARIQLDDPAAVEAALLRAEALYLQGEVPNGVGPVVFVLHGPEVAIFFRDNYERFKPIVDLAARLSAFEVVELTVCETRMGVLGRDRDQLLPFVGTVPFGPREVERLLSEQGYIYF